MYTLAVMIAEMHRQRLLEEAELERRARLARGSRPSPSAWRRGFGQLAVALALPFAWLAGSVDTSNRRDIDVDEDPAAPAPPCPDCGPAAMAA